MYLGGIALQPIGPGAHEVAFEAAGIGGRQDDGVVVIRGNQVGKAAVGCVEMKFDGVVIDRARATPGERTGECRKRHGAVGRIGEPLHRGDHVGRSHGTAVVEAHVAPQVESPHAAIGIRPPAGCEPRLKVQVRIRQRQVLTGLRQQADAAGIGDGERIDRACRHRHAHRDRAPGAGPAGSAGAAFASRRACGRGPQRRGQCGDQRRCKSENGRMAQQLAPGNPIADELVEDGVFEWIALRAQRIEATRRRVRSSSLQQRTPRP